MKIELAMMIVLGLCLVGCGESDQSLEAEAKRKAQAEKGLKDAKTLAGQGHADAQYNLAVMYDNGAGVETNTANAYVWYTIAAANGNANANERKSALAKKMTRAEITEAKALAKKMIKQNPMLLDK